MNGSIDPEKSQERSNGDREDRKSALLARLRRVLRAERDYAPSWRELAKGAGASLSTITHHFGKREDVVAAIMEDDLAGATAELEIMATADADFAASIRGAVLHLLDGMRHGGLDALFSSGLREGFSHARIGPLFLTTALEPTLQACEARLATHVARKEMIEGNLRVAALALISPVVLAALHQTKLGGHDVRPLDLDEFAKQHAERFVRAWSAKE